MNTEGGDREKLRAEMLKKSSLLRTRRDQSTRTSFALTPEGLEALEDLMKKQQKSAKEVFADIGRELQRDGQLKDFLEDLLTEEVRKSEAEVESPRMRRSFVIPESVLSRFNEITKEKKLKRDLVVETLVMFFGELVDKEYEATYQAQKNALKELDSAISHAQELFDRASETLWEEDPVREAFWKTIAFQQLMASDIADALADGTPATETVG